MVCRLDSRSGLTSQESCTKLKWTRRRRSYDKEVSLLVVEEGRNVST